MRVMIAHCRYRWSGGEETTVRNQADGLRERGHEVLEYLVTNPEGTGESILKLAAAPFNFSEYSAAREAIRRFRPNVIHVHNTWFSLSPAIFRAADMEGVPTVATIQNFRLACPQGQFFRDGGPCTDCLGRMPLPAVRYACYRDSRTLSAWNGLVSRTTQWFGLANTASSFIVPSAFARALLVHAGLPRDRTEVVYNGTRDPGRRANQPSESRDVVFVGRLSSEKGLDSVLREWQETPDDWTLNVYGDGPARTSLEDMADRRVIFHGRVGPARLQEAMLHARFLVFPSRWYEVCPLVILEAMASQLPVVGLDIGSVSELLTYVDPRSLVSSDPGAWATALERFSDDELTDTVGQRAREVYEASFTLDLHIGQLEALYGRVTESVSIEPNP